MTEASVTVGPSGSAFAAQLGDGLSEPVSTALARLELVDPDVGEKRSDTRERILTTSLRLFATVGFQATSIRTIAHEVGIKAPGVYSHFDSKETILAAALARALRDFLLFVTSPDTGLGEADLLELLVRKHVRFQIANAQVAMPSDSLIANVQFLQEIEARHLEALRDAQRAYVDLVTAGVAAAQHPSPSLPRTLAHVVITMCDGVNKWYREGGRLGADAVEDFMWDRVRAVIAS